MSRKRSEHGPSAKTMMRTPLTRFFPRRAGFTLMELLACIAIIAILGILIFPMIGASRRSTLQMKNVENLRRIGMAILTYAADHQGDVPPSSKEDPWGMPKATWGPALNGPPRYLYTSKWGTSFKGTQDYLETPDVFYSPFVKKLADREPGKFHSAGILGYILYWSTQGGLGGELSNTNIFTASPRAPIYSDYCSDLGKTYNYDHSQCSVLYLDGSVKVFDLKEVNALPFATDRLKLFMEP